jgi:hypothetical protein
VFAAMFVEAAAPAPAAACTVCFAPSKNGSLLLAYYGTTALMILLVLGIIGFYARVVVRRYLSGPRDRDPGEAPVSDSEWARPATGEPAAGPGEQTSLGAAVPPVPLV